MGIQAEKEQADESLRLRAFLSEFCVVHFAALTLRVQVPDNHIPAQNLYYNYYYPKPKHLIIGYLDPLGNISEQPCGMSHSRCSF